jgi:hypothetical protein
MGYVKGHETREWVVFLSPMISCTVDKTVIASIML